MKPKPCSDFVKTDKSLLSQNLNADRVTAPPGSNPLPLDWFLSIQGKSSSEISLVDRAVARFVEWEADARKAQNIWLAEELRQAQITVILAARGHADPFTEATVRCFACHPEQLFAKITERRKAKLGSEYTQWYDENGNLKPEPIEISAKKAPHSVGIDGERRRA